ncbi:MAG: hypothetical protein A2X46_05105 [Lentisphaerae bacterium GWF2_57_35]|nr:MAG: hypothetical protein A2X46_05105 [Lentisphaerae bacterium GWF2_57_35]
MRNCNTPKCPKRIVIIGAGPTGLGAAHRLTELGHENFVVYERNSYVGGLSSSFYDEKGFTWDFAVHVAHSHYHYVDQLMDSLLPGGYFHHERKSWIRDYDSWIPYPFQYNFRHLPPQHCDECLNGLLQLRMQTDVEKHTAKAHSIQNFKEWMLQGFGEGITRHFMLPYNLKNWSIDPALMGVQWLGDRVPVVDVERVQRNLRENRDDVEWGPNHVFQFPKRGGTGSIWREMAARLPENRITLSSEVVSVDGKSRKVQLADGTVDEYDCLISTAPLPRLAQWLAIPSLMVTASKLKYTHVYVMGLGFDSPMPKHLAEKTWIYCPGTRDVFYRVTPFSNFSPHHVPDINGSSSFLCEISRAGTEPLQNPGDFLSRVLQDMNRMGVMPESEHEVHTYPMTAEFGYPIPTLDRDDILAELMAQLEPLGIISRGRFGGWKYEVANMDHSIMQGVEAVNRILGVGEECTWPNPSRVNAGKS